MTLMGRSVRVALVLSISAFIAGLNGPVAVGSEARAAAKKAPRVLQDKHAGRHKLVTVPPQQPDTTVEPSISVNPENPLNAVAGYQAGRVDQGCAQTNGYATTFDGGKTWKYGPLPKLTVANGGTTPLASDPVVAFGPDNIVYFNSLMCDDDGNNLAFSVSLNGGKTWGPPTYVPTERTFSMDDKNWILVDNSDAPGHHLGRIYMVWDNIAPVVIMYSDDQAETWQGPFPIYGGQGLGTVPLILPNGDLAVTFGTIAYPLPALTEEPTAEEAGEISKYVLVLCPGAGSVPSGGPIACFPAPLTINSDLGTPIRGHRAGDGLPFSAVDPKSGRIFVIWSDNRFRTDVVNDVVITWSDDSGITWTTPTRVNPGSIDDLKEHFTPAIEVGKDGVVRIMYRTQQQQESIAGEGPVDTYYQQSTDSGETFSKPLRINTVKRTDPHFAAYSRASAFLGDYNQIAVGKSWAYVVRCEAYSTKPGEPATFPPTVHHQRTWVAVVDADGNGRP